jgi:tetratricopeptide (TPR) repeat protein
MMDAGGRDDHQRADALSILEMRARASSKGRSYQAGRDVHVTESPGPAAVGMIRTLPRDTVAFTGRDKEVDEVLKGAEGQGLAVHVIDGMAGVGKTALAIHLAHKLADRFPDGQLFLPLHAHTLGQNPLEPAEALVFMLAATGVAASHIPAGLDARAAMWRDRVAGKKVLLILDDAVGYQQVEPLLPATAGCLVLVTSRRRLTALHTAETSSLVTLPEDQAAELFTLLARRQVEGTEAESVNQVIALCGCLPLAIALLAGRLRHHPSWSVANLAADLEGARDRLGELQAEEVNVAAAFDLSYRGLSPDRQRFFRHLGLHPGIELEPHASAALTGVDVKLARGHLDALYDYHLLDELVHGRYRMHDLVRMYTRGRADDDGLDDRLGAITRLFTHYEKTAGLADGLLAGEHRPGATESGLSNRDDAFTWMQTERANLLACTEYAIKMGEHVRVMRFAATMAVFLRAAGPWSRTAVLHAAAASAAREIGDRRGEADALTHLGDIRQLTADYGGAAQAHTMALAIYRGLGDRLGQANVLNHLGVVRRLTDDHIQAVKAHTEALAISIELGDRPGQAAALNHLGIVLLVTGDYPGATESHTQAFGIYQDLGDSFGQAEALNELGVVRRAIGDHEGAIDAHTNALAIYRDLGDRFGEAFALSCLGAVQRLTEDYVGATESHLQALGIYRDLGNRQGHADTLNELGVVRRVTGDHEGAIDAHAGALSIYRDLGNRHGQAETLINIGTLLLDSDESHQALSQYRRALQFARDLHFPLVEARALEGIARGELSLGRFDSAVDHIQQALIIYRRLGAAEATRTAAWLRDLESPR